MDSDRYDCKLPDRRLPNRVTSEFVNQNIEGEPHPFGQAVRSRF
jgi:hypothetical protein